MTLVFTDIFTTAEVSIIHVNTFLHINYRFDFSQKGS